MLQKLFTLWCGPKPKAPAWTWGHPLDPQSWALSPPQHGADTGGCSEHRKQAQGRGVFMRGMEKHKTRDVIISSVSSCWEKPELKVISDAIFDNCLQGTIIWDYRQIWFQPIFERKVCCAITVISDWFTNCSKHSGLDSEQCWNVLFLHPPLRCQQSLPHAPKGVSDSCSVWWLRWVQKGEGSCCCPAIQHLCFPHGRHCHGLRGR